MVSNKLAITALAAVAMSSMAFAVKVDLSERCKELFKSMVGDEELNSCVPVASVVPFLNTNTVSDAGALRSIFSQLCSTQTCEQSFIDSYAERITSECSADLEAAGNPAKIVSSVLKMYTPLHKAACYVDEDREFCLAKNILALDMDITNGLPSPQELFSNVKNVDVCTKCNQHIVGTFMDYISQNTSSAFPITKQQTDKVVGEMTQMCGADFTKGLASAIEAPFPELQNLVGQSSPATKASFSVIALFVAAAATLANY